MKRRRRFGDHVQREHETSDEVRNLQREPPGEANTLSVRPELQPAACDTFAPDEV